MKLTRISSTFAIVAAATGIALKGFSRLWDDVCNAIESLSDAIDGISTQITALTAAIATINTGASIAWTPSDANSLFSWTTSGHYSRLGKVVQFQLFASFATPQVSALQLAIAGLPFPNSATSPSETAFSVGFTNAGFALYFYLAPGGQSLLAYDMSGAPVTYTMLDNKQIRMTGAYLV